MALPRNNRLKRKRDFDTVFKKGRTVGGSFLFVKFFGGAAPESRFGLVVSSRVARTAVARNRIRRVLSEAIRSNLLPAAPAYDTVVVVTRLPSDPAALRADALAALRKAHIL